MKAAKRNLIIDICAGFFCGVVIITGFLQWIFYPHQGSGPGGGFILSHAQLYNLHFAVSMIALCFVVIHLLLHLTWIRHCARTPGKKSRHLKINIGADVAGTVCGVVSLISGLVLWIVEKDISFSSVSRMPGGMTSISFRRFSLRSFSRYI